jgi:hypothetical protein
MPAARGSGSSKPNSDHLFESGVERLLSGIAIEGW